VQVALAIAGSDPTGGAGLQADVQVFRALGVHGAGVVTALTVQDSGGVHQVLPVFPTVVLDQLRVLIADILPGAVKLGMLATDDVARNVELGLAALPAECPVVVDPVLFASDGTPLLEPRAIPTLERLIGRAALVTPNLPEAQRLTGCDVDTQEGVAAAGCALVSGLGARAALVTGGHADGPPHDLLVVREGGSQVLTWLEGVRHEVGAVHGTGCTLSSAVTAYLARGDELAVAVERGRRFVSKAIEGAAQAGKLSRFLSYG